MWTKNILLWLDATLTHRFVAFYEHYYVGYILLVLLLLNAALLRHLYPGFSYSLKSQSASYAMVVIATGIILYLATLWFRQWYFVSFSPLVLGIKIASFVMIGYFVWMEMQFYLYGVSSWGSRIGVEHLIAAGLGTTLFLATLVTVTAVGAMVDWLLCLSAKT